MGNGVTQCEWRHTPETHGGFWKILKKSVRELRLDLLRGKIVGFRLLADTFVADATRVSGVGRWKGQNRKIVPLSPYVKEPLNSKVIKSFVPEQRRRQVFFVCSVLYIYGHSMYVSHIDISWLWYNARSETGQLGTPLLSFFIFFSMHFFLLWLNSVPTKISLCILR